MRNLSHALLLAVLLAQAAPAMAAIPQELAVQGVLRNDTGQLQTTSVAVSVKFFNAQTLGAQLGATVGPTTLPAANGLFSMRIPIGNADLTALMAAPEVWMEVTAGPDTFARSKVGAEMYALAAGTANSLSSSCVGCVSDGMVASSISGSKISGAVASATNFSGSLAGDVTGTQGVNVVSKIGGVSVVGTGGTNGEVLQLVGGVWTHGSNGVTSVTASGVLSASAGATPNITLTGTVPIANGGTGSITQNWVDLSNNQSGIAGNKTFTGVLQCSATNPTVQINSTVTSGLARLLFSQATAGSASIQQPGGTFGSTAAEIARRGALEIVNSANSIVSIWAGNAERFRVDQLGGVVVDPAGTNDGALNHSATSGAGLSFGNGSGEGIASKRNDTGNNDHYGLDFFTNFIKRLTIENDGDVKIHSGNLEVTNGKFVLDVYTKTCDIDPITQVGFADCECQSNQDRVVGGGGVATAPGVVLRESRPFNDYTWRVACIGVGTVLFLPAPVACANAYAICMRRGR